jgi:CRP-like cAMP-binding protein
LEDVNISNSTPWYDAIADHTVARLHKAGDVMALQGEEYQQIGYVLSGRAKAVAFSEQGESTWVGYFKTGDFFGHTSLLTDRSPPFEIIAETDVDVLYVNTSTMRTLLNEQDGLGLKMAEDLALRLNQMTQRLIEAYTLSAKGRICAELSRLSRVVGIAPDTCIIRPNPVFVELAERVNSTRETVSRTVSDLQRNGILAREPGAIIIKKPDILRKRIR